MNKLIIVLWILAAGIFYHPVLAADDYQSVKDNISAQCHGSSYEGNFFRGFACSGTQKEIFFIKDQAVTKAVYDKEKANYDLKGDLCTKTEELKAKDLPKGFSATCVKGEYGKYFAAGKAVSYSKFMNLLMVGALAQMKEAATADTINQLTKNKKILSSQKTFIAYLRSSKYGESSFSYEIVGSSCIGSGSFLINGNGYKNLKCEEGKVVTMDYYLKNKKVSFDNYIKSVYQAEKAANKKALATLKKTK